MAKYKKGEGGRPKGVTNKMSRQLKDMILGALHKAGGEKYLLAQSSANPTAFLTLVGKCVTLQLAGADGEPLKMPTVVHFISGGPQRALEPSRMTITVNKPPEAIEAGTNGHGNGNGAHS